MKTLKVGVSILMLLAAAAAGLAQDASRSLQVLNANATPGSTVAVSVQLVALGNENAIAFSVNYDPSRLTFAGIALGGGAVGTTLLTSTNQAAQGKVGVSVAQNPGQTFSTGTFELVRVTFVTSVTAGATPVSFGDTPLAREVVDAAVNDLMVNYRDGVVTVSGPTPLLTVSLTAPANGTTFTAPAAITLAATAAETGGTISQVGFYQGANLLGTATHAPYAYTWTNVEAGSYNLSAVATDGAGLKAPSSVVTVTVSAAVTSRAVALISTNATPGSAVAVSVQLVALGNENAVAFSLSYDPSRLTFGGIALGGGATGTTLLASTNQTAQGKVGVSVAQSPGHTFSAGTLELVRVTFVSRVTAGVTSVSFGDTPLAREIVDTAVNELVTNYQDGTVTIAAMSGQSSLSLSMYAGVTLTGTTGLTYRIEAGEVLGTTTNWTPLGTFTLTNTTSFFLDVESPSHPQRFYRAVLVP